MKIFVIPSWYKTDKCPENCIFIYEQVAGLAKRGHQIVVISPQLSLSPSSDSTIAYKNDGVSDILYRDYWAIWPSVFPGQNIYSYSRCATLLFEEAIKRYGMPDVIYAHFSIPAGYVASKLGKKYHVPVVVEEHHSSLMRKKWPYFKYVRIRETISNVEKFICVSEGLKHSVERHVGKQNKIMVVSNMINTCFTYNPINNNHNNHFVFLSIGSLIPRKGFVFLIRSFANVFKGWSVELRIAGQGNQRAELLKLIRELGIEKQVLLLGQLSREETLKQYKECNCFVLTSQAETYGLVYREAMAVGRPIISTRHGGFSLSDWHDDFGILINYGNSEELEKALLSVYNDFNQYDLEKISNLCLSTCSEKVVLKSIEEELKKACKILK